MVPTLDYQLDGRRHLGDLGEPRAVVAQEVRARETVEMRKAGPRNKGGHCGGCSALQTWGFRDRQ